RGASASIASCAGSSDRVRIESVKMRSISAWRTSFMLALCALAFGCGRRAPFEGEAPAPQTSSPSSAPISWAEIAQSYASVRDYTCLYEKQERAISNGEKQTIRFYFRKPFDVR